MHVVFLDPTIADLKTCEVDMASSDGREPPVGRHAAEHGVSWNRRPREALVCLVFDVCEHSCPHLGHPATAVRVAAQQARACRWDS